MSMAFILSSMLRSPVGPNVPSSLTIARPPYASRVPASPAPGLAMASCLALTMVAHGRIRKAKAKVNKVQLLGTTDPNSYVPILLEMEEGKAYQIEARPKDTVKTLKAVLNLELGVAEQAIQLSFDGDVLSDEMELTEVDLKEGSKLQMKVVEVEEDATESSGDTEGIRIVIKVDSAGKTTKVTLNLDPEEGIEDVKLEAYEQFRDKVPFLCDSPVSGYGLFLLDGTPVADSRGNLRWLKKSERLKESKTVAENGLEGGEELVFANLMWLDVGSWGVPCLSQQLGNWVRIPTLSL